ncbi:hypothetical protein THAOC_35104 [Thalassiosira oceanica]|uniref:Uncharacterized protein n=1 Tax=Thalassiosira oceanica TaxID=159749 RepID=K0RI24_THAOC|nr:hypothetical protein THAOC_35104 [Thalassiosira oceanica]|eukprot:EJK46237.1 hypothetical protein THAOC_35104 [Thalassiosira oceanica]
MPTSQPSLLREREQDNMEGIHLRRHKADGPNPRIPAVGADVFGSFVASFQRHKDTKGGVHLRRREADGPNPWFTEIGAGVFRSPVWRMALCHGVIDVASPLARLKTARIIKVDSRP